MNNKLKGLYPNSWFAYFRIVLQHWYPEAMHKVSFIGQDGLKRIGLYHPQGQGAVVVCCHGLFSWKGDEGSKFAQLAELLKSHDISLFRFDCTGCGESDGSFSQSTLAQRMVDLHEAVLMLESSALIQPNQPLILVGSSFGGPVILSAAPGIGHPILALITWSAPIDMVRFYQDRYSPIFQQWQQGETVEVEHDGRLFSMSPAFLESLQSIDPLQEIVQLAQIPLLIIHGAKDETVPVHHAELLRSRYPGPSILEIIPGADHRLHSHFQSVGELTVSFILEHLRKRLTDRAKELKS